MLSLKARVNTVKTVFAGEFVGYGFTFTAPKDMKIAVLTIGYADGLPRGLSCGVGHVLINGHRASIVGRVCMDQTIVDVTDIETVERGDIAVVIGKSGEAEITACDIATQVGTISNEILGRLGIRLNRCCIM
ncbi:MAG: alanine racemase C-terminal domain-containing protein [Anaerolineae bacterium]